MEIDVASEGFFGTISFSTVKAFSENASYSNESFWYSQSYNSSSGNSVQVYDTPKIREL